MYKIASFNFYTDSTFEVNKMAVICQADGTVRAKGNELWAMHNHGISSISITKKAHTKPIN